MPALGQILPPDTDFQRLRRMPDQAQVQPEIRRNRRHPETVCRNLVIHVIPGGIEFHVPGQVEIRAQLKLVLRIALKSGRVGIQIHMEPRVARQQAPIIRHFPLRGKFATECLGRACILDGLRKNGKRALNITAVGDESQQLVILIVESGKIERQSLGRLNPVTQFVSNQVLGFRIGISK